VVECVSIKMKRSEKNIDKTPKLTLVGAGPGDPELITLKAIRALECADVVLYDALINEDLLKYCPDHCEKIFVGKKPYQKSISQDSINYMIVEKALERGHVVRLKGGDPFIFGRGQEEIDFAKKFAIHTSYIPGISSITAGSNINIPLTARGVSESFWVITGTRSDRLLSDDLLIAMQTTATIVILMGMSKLDLISDIFNQSGSGNVPAAIIQNASSRNQKSIVGCINDLPTLAQEQNISSPAVIIIGEVVRFYSLEKIYSSFKETVMM